MSPCSAAGGCEAQWHISKRHRLSQRLGRTLLEFGAVEVPDSELGGSALVFSPHPDDESLGCGGAILRKKQMGASVKLVHMSDGGASSTLIPRETLTSMRRRESENAGRVLGVDDIYFLEYPDSQLSEYIEAGTERVEQILRRESPDEVFVPYRREPMRQAADHVAVTQMVLAAIERIGRTVTVWEYPVWFWLHWPWVGLRQSTPPIRSKHILKNSVLERFGVRALLEMKSAVNIAAVLGRKHAALAEHKSQMEQLVADPRWVTLDSISSGELLDCFYRDYEYFRRYTHRGSNGSSSTGL